MKKHNKTRWLLPLLIALVLAIAVSACGGAARAETQAEPAIQPAVEAQAPALQEPETKTLYIGPKLEDCTGAGAQKCMMVRENPDEDYQYFYDPIAGFDYEEGYEYEIVVTVEKVENPPADGSSLKYSLVKIIDKTPVSEEATAEMTSAGDQALEGVEWQLVSLRDQDGKMIDVLADAPITLTFADGRAAGSAGCNRYFTGYETNGDQLKLDDKIGATMMACPEPVMKQEHSYLSLLPQTATFDIDAGKLTLIDAEGDALLVFEAPVTAASPEEALKLVGPVWQWQRTEMSNDTTITITNPVSYTVQFKDDGAVTVKADCKRAAGAYSDDNGSLSIELDSTTMNICSDGSMSEEFLTELSDAATYVFDEDGNLVINMKMDGGNIFLAPAEEMATSPTETPEEAAAMQKLAGVYKVILPPLEEGGSLRVATLTLNEDGALSISVLALDDEKPVTAEGVWWVKEPGKLAAKLTSEEGSDEFVLDISENGDLVIENEDISLIKIDESTPLHKQLPIPVITEQKAYVTLDIQAGNPLDPFIVSVNGGGAFDASTLGGDCSGYVNFQPVARIDWEGKADLAKIFFYSDHDPTLIIQSPDGEFHCNDDASNLLLDPSVSFENPADGIYNIWIGSYYADQLIPGVLVVTTREDVNVDTFTLNGLIKRGPVADVAARIDAKPVQTLVDIIQRHKQMVKKMKAGGKAQSVRVTAKGDVPAFEFDIPDQVCNGFISEAPDMVFDWSGEADALTVFFEGDADSTLLVVGPGETVQCNDDASADNANPVVVIPNPAQGRYAVFVGRVHPDETVKGKLTVTAAPHAAPKTLAPQPAPPPAPESDQQ